MSYAIIKNMKERALINNFFAFSKPFYAYENGRFCV